MPGHHAALILFEASDSMRKLQEAVTLRPVRVSDAKFMFECEQDSEARAGFATTPKSAERVRIGIRKALREMRKAKPGEEWLAIENRGKTVGGVWLTELNRKNEEHKACVSVVVHKDFRNRGIGTAALRLLASYAFGKRGLRRLYTYVSAGNKSSRRALEKAGYRLEGILKKDTLKNGRYLDVCVYARVR